MDEVISKLFSKSFDPSDMPDIDLLSFKDGKLTGLKDHTLIGTCITKKDKNMFRELQTTVHVPKLHVNYKMRYVYFFL